MERIERRMTSMKFDFRRASIGAVGALALVVAGCAGGTPTGTPSQDPVPTTSEPAGDPTTEQVTETETEVVTEEPSETESKDEGGDPEPSSTDDTNPEDRAPGPVKSGVLEGATEHLQYFDVTVKKTEGDGDGTAMGALIEVCYAAEWEGANDDGTVRTSIDPWSFGFYDGEGGSEDDVKFTPVSEFEPSTAWSPAYEEKNLKLGECNEGWITAKYGNPDLIRHQVRYAPKDFGDDVTWKVNHGEN